MVAAGGPGDHPLNDILHYKIDTYGKSCDDLIREISNFISENKMFELFDWFDNDYLKNLSKFELELRAKLNEVRHNAEMNGWEV